MPDRPGPTVAIVDYGLGNLFSVKHACEQAGLRAQITNSKRDILAAAAVVLPGVGAFGVAMETLTKLDLVGCLQEVAGSGKALLGICLGMQLLMTESYEFGRHRGLGLIGGTVERLPVSREVPPGVKIPQVGWNKIYAACGDSSRPGSQVHPPRWNGTILDGIPDGEHMYFVHSYYCRPTDAQVVLATTRYGETEFCSALSWRNVSACQFHPERSGPQGIHLYKNLAMLISQSMPEAQGVR